MPRAANRAVGRFENLRGEAEVKGHLMEQTLPIFQPKSEGDESDRPTSPLPTSYSSNGPENSTYHKAPAENS